MGNNINTSINVQNKFLGFGEHISAQGNENYNLAKKVAHVSLIVLGILLAGTTLATLSIFIPVIPLSISAGLIVGTSIASFASIASITALMTVVSRVSHKVAYCKNINAIASKVALPPVKLGEFSSCRSLACMDTKESFEWKKKLIASANDTIVLSGNYCGGESFDEILDLISKQMNSKPNLKVVILSSDRFINESNKKRIEALESKFPKNFSLVESPDIWHVEPGLKRSTNHSKFLAIDSGKYFLLGGSGIEDKYAYASGLETDVAKKNPSKGMLNSVLPQNFRDQDFVFSSDSFQGSGRRLYIESLKLAMQWEGSNHGYKRPEVSLARNLLLEETDESKVLERAVKRENCTVEKFDKDKSTSVGNTKILCQGPDHVANPYAEEILKQVNNAKERIIIDHMYFHPTPEIVKALAKAANRGVHIQIITNGAEKDSPITHRVFAPRNRYNYQHLAQMIKPKAKGNLEVYEFNVPQTTLHKKVIVVDDCVIAGSSNLGYKSLVTMSDHEVNFVTEDKKFAKKVLKVVEEDRSNARLIQQPGQKLSLRKNVMANLHYVGAPLIG